MSADNGRLDINIDGWFGVFDGDELKAAFAWADWAAEWLAHNRGELSEPRVAVVSHFRPKTD